MFGSNFTANFGIPDFPFQGVDAQGGMFAPNTAMPGQNPSQNAAPAIGQPMTNPAASPGAVGGAAPPAAPSPFAGGPLSPGGGVPPSAATPGAIHTSDNTIEQTAPPAAGIGSPFGKPQV